MLYSCEMLGENLRKISSVAIFSIYGIVGTCVHAISMRWNHYLYYIVGSFLVVGFSSLNYLYFVESPFFLLKKNDIKQLECCLIKICSRNFKGSQRDDRISQIRGLLEKLPAKSGKLPLNESLLDLNSNIEKSPPRERYFQVSP